MAFPDMDCPGVELAVDGAVLVLTLDRPAAFNALDEGMVESLVAVFTALHDHPEIRVVVFRAQGKHFCAGLDLKAWGGSAETRECSVGASLHMQRRIGTIVKLMRSCPQPVIGLGHGAAAGGGMSLLLACDVRYGTPDLRMNAAYVKIGLGGCDIASSYFLPRLVGSSLAAEMLLTGRFLGAERAFGLGLLSEIVPPEQLIHTGLALARDMLALSPMGLRLTKDVLNMNIDAGGLEAAMALEDRQQVMLTMTRDHGEAVAAFLEKRSPRFEDR